MRRYLLNAKEWGQLARNGSIGANDPIEIDEDAPPVQPRFSGGVNKGEFKPLGGSMDITRMSLASLKYIVRTTIKLLDEGNIERLKLFLKDVQR